MLGDAEILRDEADASSRRTSREGVGSEPHPTSCRRSPRHHQTAAVEGTVSVRGRFISVVPAVFYRRHFSVQDV